VGKKFWIQKFNIFLSDVCYDLSLWWHLSNLVIAFKQIKTVKITKNNLVCCFFFVLTTYTHQVQMCCMLLFTSVYNHVQLWSFIHCLLWPI
jgi:hypothetical protein